MDLLSRRKSPLFYGWWIVLACGLVAVIGWSLGVFGMGVYIHALSETRGFSISLVSTAVTFSYLVNAACLMSVGTATAELGAKPVLATGVVALALSVAGLGYCRESWQLFGLFAVMGIGRSCLSTTTISTTLAPWFELHQGRAVSVALLGASVGGMISTPLLLSGIALLGVKQTFGLAGLASTIVLLPVVVLVLKRSPQELGLLPDGGLEAASTGIQQAEWSRNGAMRTRQFQSQLLAFALAMLVQIAFLSHHVPIVAPILGDAGASTAVSLAAAAAFGGRVALARFADGIDLRLTTAGVMLLGTVSLAYMSNATSAFSLLLASAMYGLTIGNLTTLSPLIARREFGAVSFGSIYGLIGAAIAFATAFGPAICGLLRDSLGSYGPPLLLFGAINLIAAGIIVWGGRKPMPQPS
jgi:MFS family permease